MRRRKRRSHSGNSNSSGSSVMQQKQQFCSSLCSICICAVNVGRGVIKDIENSCVVPGTVPVGVLYTVSVMIVPIEVLQQVPVVIVSTRHSNSGSRNRVRVRGPLWRRGYSIHSRFSLYSTLYYCYLSLRSLAIFSWVFLSAHFNVLLVLHFILVELLFFPVTQKHTNFLPKISFLLFDHLLLLSCLTLSYYIFLKYCLNAFYCHMFVLCRL